MTGSSKAYPGITWIFPKILCGFAQDSELDGNSESKEVEKGFSADKARFFEIEFGETPETVLF